MSEEKMITILDGTETFAERPTGELRFVRPPFTTTRPDLLQQRWDIAVIRNGNPCMLRYEWRDVPVVIE